MKKDARRGASFNADQHDQSGVDVLKSRAMEGGGRAGGAADRNDEEGAGTGASGHTDQHGQSGVDVHESRAMEGSRGAGSANDANEKESTGSKASRHAERRAQPITQRTPALRRIQLLHLTSPTYLRSSLYRPW